MQNSETVKIQETTDTASGNKLIEDFFNPDSRLVIAELHNDHYQIKIRYLFTYAEDLKNHALSSSWIDIDIKSKCYFLPILAYAHPDSPLITLFIDYTNIRIFGRDDILHLLKEIEWADNMIPQLEPYLIKYFPGFKVEIED